MFGTYPPDRDGGAGFLGRYSAALAEAGARVHVITTMQEGRVERLDDGNGVVVHRVVADWRLRSARETLRRVTPILQQERIDVVHVFFPDAIFQAQYQVPILIGIRSVPLVTTFWNLGIGRRSPMRIRAEAVALLARSSVVTSHDPLYLRALQHLVGWARPVRWLPVGSNIALSPSGPREELRRKLGLPDDTPLLSYFGYLDFTRGAEDLYTALAMLRRSQDVRLVMVGGAARDVAYKHEAERRGLGGAVIWTGFLPEQDAADALAATDLCVLPYRRNSIGRSALAAALTLGVPTVLGGVPSGIAPLVPDEHVALVPPGDTDQLAAMIASLLRDPVRRAQLGAGGREAASFFAWDRIAAAGLGVYREVIQER